jgi:hypothetical protein
MFITSSLSSILKESTPLRRRSRDRRIRTADAEIGSVSAGDASAIAGSLAIALTVLRGEFAFFGE